jgi:PIN domain nuclease of toxin-antitoxin system
MRVMLDTVAFIKGVQGTLPHRLQRRLQKSTTEILVSIVTPWEIALKPSLHKLTTELVERALVEMGARLLPITLTHTGILYKLPLHHAEPFDRMIIAQALSEPCPVVSSDRRFPLYETVGSKVVWD